MYDYEKMFQDMKNESKTIKIQINTLIRAIELTSKEDSYDKRSSKKLSEKFNNLKLDYSSLYDFFRMVKNTRRYYKCKNCVLLANEIADIIACFTKKYHDVL